jgi:predicted transcriptional regulator
VQFRKPVASVAHEDTLSKVLSTAFECGFSQFPVVNDDKFGGLITEREIVRWLGRRAREHKAEVNLSSVLVKDVLREQDPFMKGISVFIFAKPDAPVDEVMARFATQQALEVIFITRCGTKKSPIEGIVTQWDAARFAN